MRALVASSPKPQRLFYSGYVTRTAGAAIAVVLEHTPITPNIVTILGLGVHVIAAVALAVADVPIGIVTWITVLVLWQLAFALDGADGQLARLRGRSSAFGGWLDAWADVVTHVLVYGALMLYVVEAVGLGGRAAAASTSIVVGCHLIQLLTGWQHVRVRSEPAIARPSRLLALATQGIHLLDYGWFLLLAAVLLPWPHALLVYLITSSLLHAGAAVMQLALNWRRELADDHLGGSDPPRSGGLDDR